MEKFKVGEVVLYQNGDCFELGIVKRVCDNGDCFVWYHTGDTAARTPSCYLHKLTNSYAFFIMRLSCDFNPNLNEALKCLEELRSNLGVIYNNTLDIIEQVLLHQEEQIKFLLEIKLNEEKE